MAKNSVTDEIRARVEAFAEELSNLIRDSAMETVRTALGGTAPRRAGRGAGRAAASVRAGSREKGQKRDPSEIERLTSRLLDYVKGNAGQRIEQIAVGLGTSTKELNLPVKKLISQKALRTKGQKRATQYFAR
jgi:hypothetical protein